MRGRATLRCCRPLGTRQKGRSLGSAALPDYRARAVTLSPATGRMATRGRGLQCTCSWPGRSRPPHRLTLVLEEQDLHAVQGEGLSEAVRHGVLLFLEDLGNLGVAGERLESHSPRCPVQLWELRILSGPNVNLFSNSDVREASGAGKGCVPMHILTRMLASVPTSTRCHPGWQGRPSN